MTTDQIFSKDQDFDRLYPEHIQRLSRKHWSPLDITIKAADFLAEPKARVLDIGSGVGKFCLPAAYHHPDTFFYGAEQRADLVHLAELAQQKMQLSNIQFIHTNITQINFKEFDHFYYYNSFYENIDQLNSIDDTIETSIDLYLYYCKYLYAELQEKPSGTKLVTYQSLEQEIPPTYQLTSGVYGNFLKMWIKE
jgi:hypothetical protein